MQGGTLPISSDEMGLHALAFAGVIGPAPEVPCWYAIHTKSNFEKQVTANLTLKRLDTYLPTFPEVHRWKDCSKRVDVPLFPGYVFARFRDLGEDRMAVLRTPGTVRILGQAGKIEPIPDREVESIRILLRSKLAFSAHPFLRQGARVRVNRGALKDVDGVLVRFKGQTRLVLSVDLLAQSVALEIDAEDVEPI